MSYEFEAPKKDPSAILLHGMNWATYLDEGETITGTPTVTAPDGLTVDQVSVTGGVVSWRVSGGVAGRDYIATCRIDTSTGRRDERSVRYPVRER